MLLISLYLYMTVALMMTGYALFAGVLRRPEPIAFSGRHRSLLLLTVLAVGIAWPLFVPAATVWYGQRIRSAVKVAVPEVRVMPRGVRAHS